MVLSCCPVRTSFVDKTSIALRCDTFGQSAPKTLVPGRNAKLCFGGEVLIGLGGLKCRYFSTFLVLDGVMGIRSAGVLVTALVTATLSTVNAADWPRFRGPNGTGITTDGAPVTWSDDNGVRWKTELPGRGVSSPIVVGDRVFVTCYSGYGTGDGGSLEDLKRHLVCADRANGKVLWTKTVDAVLPEDPYSPPGVTSHGYASNTPASDGKMVYAFFGKSGVHAYDFDGNLIWQASVGTGSGPQRWGSAASPLVHENLVIVTAAEESESIVAIDKTTGKTAWTVKNPGFQSTWGTPVIAKTDAGTEVIISVPGEVWGFNADTGKLRWFSRGTTDSSASTSLAIADGVVYAVGGRGGDAVAVKVGGKGDVNDSAVLWDGNIQGRFASPIAYEGHLYTVNNDVLSCFDATTGDQVFQQRLPETGNASEPETPRDGERRGSFGGGGPGGGGGRGGSSHYSSPVLANGKLYVTLKSGTVHVLEAGKEFKVLASNVISGDTTGFDATPAISSGELFLRSGQYLYCVGEAK